MAKVGASTTSGQSWNDATLGSSGPVVLPTGFYAAASGQVCNVARPLTCCFAPRTVAFVGYTTASYTGNLGGFVGANAKCATEFPGSWLCTIVDYQKANPITATAGAWIDFNRYANGERNIGACAAASQSWGDATASPAGVVVQPSGSYGTAGLCNVARPLTCCR